MIRDAVNMGLSLNLTENGSVDVSDSGSLETAEFDRLGCEERMDALRSCAIRISLAAAVAVLAAGCATTVYKSTAGDYVDAAKQITVAMQSAEVSRSNADALAKIDLMASDKLCPIQRPNGVYLRPSALGMTDVRQGYFDNLVKKSGLDSSAIAPKCRKLSACDLNGGCSGACLDSDESACLDQIAHYYSTATGADDKAVAARENVGAVIADMSYPTKSVDTYLAITSVKALGAYLDLLGKAADGKTKDFKGDASDLADDVKSATDTYKSVVGKDLVPADKTTNAENGINALGAVIQDIATMVQNAQDTAAIKAAVNKYDKNVDSVMTDIETFVVATIQLAGAQASNANADLFTELQRKFAASASVLERRAIIAKLQPLYSDDVTAAVASAHAVFKKARESHDTLIQLINDPSNEQLKQIRAQEFASFRSTAADFGSLIMLFAK